jgi:molecular chaperone DnaJ
MDHYEVLGISKEATFDEIKSAYRTLARKYHPDTNKDFDAADQFKQVNEAHHVLGDPGRRSKYDKRGSHIGNPFYSSWSDISPRGRDISSEINISLNDVFFGCKKEVTYKRANFCDKCNGHGAEECLACSSCKGKGSVQLSNPPFLMQVTCPACGGVGVMKKGVCSKCNSQGEFLLDDCSINVSVPKGILEGSKLKVKGQGNIGKEINGDLYLTVNVENHPIFFRDNKNLILDVPVSYTQLVLGDKLEIPTLNSGKVSINVPAGTMNGTKFRLKGLGLPDTYDGVGDIIVDVALEVPKKINEKHEKILIELCKLEQKEKK